MNLDNYLITLNSKFDDLRTTEIKHIAPNNIYNLNIYLQELETSTSIHTHASTNTSLNKPIYLIGLRMQYKFVG
jgi:hypothetical protein